MKKYFTMLLLAFFAVAVISCNDRDDVVVQDNVIPAVMRDIRGSFTSANSYRLFEELDLNDTDIVLVYRNANSDLNTSPAWQLLPKTEYLDGIGEIDYNVEFNSQIVNIFTVATFNYSTLNSEDANRYILNQQFRIVLIPAQAGKNSAVNYDDYESVIKFYNIDESKIKPF